MTETNPYQSPATTVVVPPQERAWREGAEAILVSRGLLQRKVTVHRPVEVTIEYHARGLSDRILLDGKTVVRRLPVFWFYERLDFDIPYREGTLPATVRLKIGRRLRIVRFEIEIDGVIVYSEQG